MDIESQKKRVMLQAEQKHFGVKPEDIIFSEKIALIHSEITEAYQAFLAKKMEGKDGFYEELGDILQRTLHLGGIFGISFQKPIDCNDISSFELDKKLLTLHKISSEAFENFRHKKDDEFAHELQRLAFAVLQISKDYKFSLEDAIKLKIERNLGREWDPNKYRETFTGEDKSI